MTEERRRYYFLNRPPSIGTHPAGEILGGREVWMPGRSIPGDPHNRPALGWVEYAEPLTVEQAWKYELQPADRVELYRYRVYTNGDRSFEYGQETVLDFAEQGREWLEVHKGMSLWAELAIEYLDLREAGLIE